MKKHKPVKHAHRRAMIAQKKAKGKYSRRDLPKRYGMICNDCWAFRHRKYCGNFPYCWG